MWRNADGALPEIQISLQSEEVMAGIRSEIADAIATELGPELPQVARDVADSLYSQWTEVKRNIRVVLELANESDAYRSIMSAVETPAQLQRLVAITGALTGTSGRGAVVAAAESGALSRALQSSADLTPIIQATGSLDTALDWVTAAGEMAPDVVRLEIYTQKSPADLDRATLQRLIALDNPQSVAAVALLPNEQLATLLALSSESLRTLASALTSEQLGWLATTLKPMAQAERNSLVSRLVSDPALIAVLQRYNLPGDLPPGVDIDHAIGFLSSRADVLGHVQRCRCGLLRPGHGGHVPEQVWREQIAAGGAGRAAPYADCVAAAVGRGAWPLSPVFTIAAPSPLVDPLRLQPELAAVERQ